MFTFQEEYIISKFIAHIAHKDCGSSDGLAVYEEKNGNRNGYCFACSSYLDSVGYTDGPRRVSVAENMQSMVEIWKYPSPSLVDRRLNKASLDHFGVKVGLSQTDGETPEVLYFPYFRGDKHVGWKCKLIPNKMFWTMGDMKDAEFFGWEQALASGNKRLYITEGEIDAITTWQVLKKKSSPDYAPPAVVSLPNGAGSAKKFLSNNLDTLRRFKEIVFVFDQDEAGKTATEEATLVIPQAKSIQLPGKDPSACLVEGKERALQNALLFQISATKNTKVVLLDSLVDAALAPIPMGLTWPWQGFTKITRGLRFGETYYFGAGVKMGKSDLANTFVSHFAVEHGLPVYIANMEETNVKSTKKILGKVAGKIFHDPNVPFLRDDLLVAAEKIKGKVHFVDAFQHISWEFLQKDIYACVHNLGVKVVLIDPITNLTNGIGAGETDAVLRGVAQDLAAMARDLDIAIFIFCHLRSPDGNSSHERGAKVQSFQFTGSRAMARSCNYMVGLEGDKDPLKERAERDTRKLVVLEDREFGETGIVNLFWDYRTQLFEEFDLGE